MEVHLFFCSQFRHFNYLRAPLLTANSGSQQQNVETRCSMFRVKKSRKWTKSRDFWQFKSLFFKIYWCRPLPYWYKQQHVLLKVKMKFGAQVCALHTTTKRWSHNYLTWESSMLEMNTCHGNYAYFRYCKRLCEIYF